MKIISGGQTGADRAALDAAIELGLSHGGWVPAGRWAEDGPLPQCYNLQETGSREPAARTELNVCDADATLIFSHGALSGGSALTLSLARRYGKPVLHLDLLLQSEAAAVAEITAWCNEIRPDTLNVAGPRASNDPLIYDAVARVMRAVFESQ